MYDRCAAGTGKFLEIMAHTLGYSLEYIATDSGAVGVLSADTNFGHARTSVVIYGFTQPSPLSNSMFLVDLPAWS